MSSQLPPPDPHESPGMPSGDDVPVFAPTAVFTMGSPSPQDDRLSDLLLAIRPGLLIVVAPAA